LYHCCDLGFMPSHHVSAGVATAVVVAENHQLWDYYGGWYIMLFASKIGDYGQGWTALEPSDSAYATTSKVPAAPAGSAVEFAVDYAAGTCRVAFYTPAAVAGGFVQAPHAKMELRFVATEAIERYHVPARPVPTLADSGVELYPAVATSAAGAIWRFVSEQSRAVLT
jgi:hypothetical protein